MTHKIKFQISEGGYGKVWLDGAEISPTEISYRAKWGEVEVTLKLVAEVDGEIEVRELTNRPDGMLKLETIGQKDPVYFKVRS